jgi:hypothetical protein
MVDVSSEVPTNSVGKYDILVRRQQLAERLM